MLYMDMTDVENPGGNAPLQVRTIWRVRADRTYQVCNPAESSGKQIFVYTDGGCGLLRCSQGEFRLEAGSGLLFTVDTVYQYHPEEDHWDFWWFEFWGEPVCAFGRSYDLREMPWIGELCERAFALHPTRAEAAASCLSFLLTMAENSVPRQLEPMEDLFLQAQAMIRERLYEINVGELSKALHVEPRTLYNVFRRFADCSPKEYLQRHVMEQAQRLLSRTTMPIGQIAAELGFSSQFHFSRCFRDHMGCTPSQYRRFFRNQI